MDLPFVFDNPRGAGHDRRRGCRPCALAARISATWIAFARNGSPDNSGLPPWPPYTSPDRAAMILDTGCHVAHDPDRATRQLWSRAVASSR